MIPQHHPCCVYNWKDTHTEALSACEQELCSGVPKTCCLSQLVSKDVAPTGLLFVMLLQTLDAFSPMEQPPLLGIILRLANDDDASFCAQAAAAACELACSCRDPVCALVLSDTLRCAVLQHSKVRHPQSLNLISTELSWTP